MALERTLTIAALISSCLLTQIAHAFDAAFSIGDRIATIGDAPLMTGSQTLAVLPAGTRLVATDVQNDWVAVTVNRGGR